MCHYLPMITDLMLVQFIHAEYCLYTCTPPHLLLVYSDLTAQGTEGIVTAV
jgi:hypothetical protein